MNLILTAKKTLLIVIASFWILQALLSLAIGGVTWDEIFDFEGANGAFWHGVSILKGEHPDLNSITFDLEYFGNATRWPTFLLWKLLYSLDWDNLLGITRSARFILSGYVGLNHLNSILFGLLGIFLVYFIAELISRKTGFFAALLLALLPVWSGHSWMNSKDIPFATAYLAYTLGSTLIISRQLNCGESNTRTFHPSSLLRLVGISLMLGSRVASFPFVLVTEVALLVAVKKSYFRNFFVSLFFGVFFGYTLTPQAWNSPIGYPIEAISFIRDRQGGGSFVTTLSYICDNLFSTLPFVHLAGIILAVFGSLLLFKRSNAVLLPILLQIFIAPSLLLFSGNSLYNELRHLMFIYPALTVVASLGLCGVAERLRARRALLVPYWCAFTVSVVILIVQNASLTPYQYLYKSELARLVSHPEHLSIDYWGFSVRELFRNCNKNDECSKALLKYPLRKNGWSINPEYVEAFSYVYQPIETVGAEAAQGLVIGNPRAPLSCKLLASVRRPVLGMEGFRSHQIMELATCKSE